MTTQVESGGHETIRSRLAAYILPAVLLVGAAAFLVAGWWLTLTSLILVGGIVSWRGVVNLIEASSWIGVDPGGFTIGRSFRRTSIPWDQVTEIQVYTRGGLRNVRVHRHLNQPVVLPVLRSSDSAEDPTFNDRVLRFASWSRAFHPGGVPVGHLSEPSDRRIPAAVAAVVVLTLLLIDQPWNASWWPGRSEAAALPAPCQAIPQELLVRAIDPAGEPIVGDNDRSAMVSCSWQGQVSPADLSWKTAQSLEIVFWLSKREFLDSKSATDLAIEDFGRERQSARPAPGPLAGVGDEAFAIIPDPRGKAAYDAQVWVRRANVSISVAYRGTSVAPDDARTALAEVARAAAAAVHTA